MSHPSEVHELMKSFDTEDILFRKIDDEAAQMALLLNGQIITETRIRQLMDAGASIAIQHVGEQARESNRIAREMQG